MTKVWDIRSKGIDEWEVFCLLHGEVDEGFQSAERAIERASYYNENENGNLHRTRKGHDIMDYPYTSSEEWCHGGKSKSHFLAGWYEPDSWAKNNFTFVGKKLV